MILMEFRKKLNSCLICQLLKEICQLFKESSKQLTCSQISVLFIAVSRFLPKFQQILFRYNVRIMAAPQITAADSIHNPLQQFFKMDCKNIFNSGLSCRNEKWTSLITQHTLCTHTNLFLSTDSTSSNMFQENYWAEFDFLRRQHSPNNLSRLHAFIVPSVKSSLISVDCGRHPKQDQTFLRDRYPCLKWPWQEATIDPLAKPLASS